MSHLDTSTGHGPYNHTPRTAASELLLVFLRYVQPVESKLFFLSCPGRPDARRASERVLTCVYNKQTFVSSISNAATNTHPRTMFAVSSGWAKLRPNRTRGKAVTMRELETWEKRRREKAAEIEARRRIERAAASLKRLPAGYARNGVLPEYVRAHLVSLQASPLGKPARSSATVCSSPSTGRRHRHVQNIGWASDETVVPGRQTSPSPEKHRRQVKQGVAASTAIAATSGHPIKREKLTIIVESKRGRQPHVQSMTTGSGRCSTTMQKHEHEGSAAVASLVPSRADPNIRNAATTSRVVGRPTSAPSAPGRRSKRTFSGGSGQQGNDCLAPSPADTNEAGLLEKLASLTCLRPEGEFPTVAALRTAVTIEAIHAQLRECRRRRKVGGGSKAAAGLPHRGVSATAVPGVHQPADEFKTDTTWRTAPRRRRETEPWEYWSPFVPENSSTGRTRTAGRADRPMSAPALRILASNDPVFRNADEYRGGWRRRHPARSHSPHPPKTIVPNDDEEQAPNGCCCRYPQTPHGKENGCTEASSATTTTVVAAVRKMEAFSRQLTVGALIELSHLRNPPEPVRAVQAALACLLGWQQWKPSRDPVPCAPRSLFGNAYLLRDILNSVCPQRISGSRLAMLEKRLRLQEAVPARVRGANAAAAVVLEWLLAVVACARAEGEQRCAEGEH